METKMEIYLISLRLLVDFCDLNLNLLQYVKVYFVDKNMYSKIILPHHC